MGTGITVEQTPKRNVTNINRIMDTTQTTQQEGNEEKAASAPTPENVMQGQDSAPKADPESQEAKQQENLSALSLEELSKTAGRQFNSPEEAKKWVTEVNSYVGDQTRVKKDRALSLLAEKAGLSVDELIEVIDSQDLAMPQTNAASAQSTSQSAPDTANIRVTRLEVKELVEKQPEAAAVRDALLAEALATGKAVEDIWNAKYAPVLEAGKKVGAKKLQSNLEGQPTKAASTASESTDTKVDFSGANPETGKRWTAEEMEKYLGYRQPSQRL